jgi:hypothetical protein
MFEAIGVSVDLEGSSIPHSNLSARIISKAAFIVEAEDRSGIMAGGV